MRHLLVILLASAVGCTTQGLIEQPDAAAPQDAGPQGPPDAGRMPDAGPKPDAGPNLADVLIYAHSRNVLYTFSPYTNTVEEIGEFHTAGGGEVPFMADLAVDSEGVIITSSQRYREQPPAIWLVDPETAEVTLIGEFPLNQASFNALTFLAREESPDGTEMLIGATDDGAYFEIDRETAQMEYLGAYPDDWVSSGDIVSVDGLGTFATLKRSDYPVDVLAKIEFWPDGTSRVAPIGGICPPSGTANCPDEGQDFRQLFGLGYWGENLYGFSNSGQLIRIDRDNGRGEVVSTATGADSFWGAGVTVEVPVVF